MSHSTLSKSLALAGCLLVTSPLAIADDKPITTEDLQQQLQQLQAQVDQLQQQSDSKAAAKEKAELKIGGAIRFQYSNASYDKDGVQQKGKLQFDTFRLNIDGKKGDVIVSAEWRWYEYMTTLRHAWVGYDINEHNQVQLGLTRIPFGNQSYNSHNFFLSSNYYLGLEDSFALGGLWVNDTKHWNLQLGFFKNGARGVGGNNENYSYDLVADGSGNTVGVSNTGAARLVSKLTKGNLTLEAGASGLYGGIYHSGTSSRRAGNYGAYALHTDIGYNRFNLKLQATHYDYRFDNGDTVMQLGAYAGNYDTPTRAHTYTAGVSYHLPVTWRFVSGLDFYNDYSAVTHKSNDAAGQHIASSYMNVTGIGISAGGVYAYADYINARNQPFVGSDFAGSSGDDVEHRFNLNVGYYF